MAKQEKGNNSLSKPVFSTGSSESFINRWNNLTTENSSMYEGKNLFLAEHFNYEIGMLRFADSKLDELNAEIYMAGESFLIHWRGLIEFFYYPAEKEKGKGKKGKKRKHSDAKRAYDFVDRDKWEEVRKDMPDEVCEWYERAHKEIAHLTRSRKEGSPPEKDWFYKDMMEQLEDIIRRFLDLQSSEESED